jgi:hypothetical protein
MSGEGSSGTLATGTCAWSPAGPVRSARSRYRVSGTRWPQSARAFHPCRHVFAPTHGPLGTGTSAGVVPSSGSREFDPDPDSDPDADLGQWPRGSDPCLTSRHGGGRRVRQERGHPGPWGQAPARALRPVGSGSGSQSQSASRQWNSVATVSSRLPSLSAGPRADPRAVGDRHVCGGRGLEWFPGIRSRSRSRPRRR